MKERKEQSVLDVLTLREVSERLRLSTQTVRLMLRAGKIAAIRVGERRGQWRILASDLENFLRGGRGGGDEQGHKADQVA